MCTSQLGFSFHHTRSSYFSFLLPFSFFPFLTVSLHLITLCLFKINSNVSNLSTLCNTVLNKNFPHILYISQTRQLTSYVLIYTGNFYYILSHISLLTQQDERIRSHYSTRSQHVIKEKGVRNNRKKKQSLYQSHNEITLIFMKGISL